MLLRPAARLRPPRWWLVSAVGAVGAGALIPVACSDDTTPATDPGPTGQPTIRIDAPAQDGCVAIGDSSDVRVPFTVNLVDPISKQVSVYLRPPGTCEVVQCGSLVLKARLAPKEPDDADAAFEGISPNNAGATTTIDFIVAPGTLGNKYGAFEVQISLVGNDGLTPLLDHDGKAVNAVRTLTLAKACPDGGGGGGGAGGAGGVGGIGGMGGAAGGGGGAAGGGGAGGAAGAGGA